MGLGGFLEVKEMKAVTSDVVFVLNRKFKNEFLELELVYEKLGTLRESYDFTEMQSTCSESIGHLD